MHLFDTLNNIFLPRPSTARYWEIITQISIHNNISLKESAKEFFKLSGIPSSETSLEVILNADEKDLTSIASISAGR